MNDHIEEVFKQNGSFSGIIRLHHLRMLAFAAQAKIEEAITEGYNVLQKMGFCKNLSRNPGALHVLKELLKTRRMMNKAQGSLMQMRPW